jgi:mRNA interferase YafQ
MNKYELVLSGRFKKDLKQCVKRNFEISKMENVVEILLSGKKLPDKYRDHSLTGRWKTHRECHLYPDWLLVYRIEDDILVLTLTRTGTHSDLFG